MALFYYYDQNPSGFSFLVQIIALCYLNLAGITKFKCERKNEINSGRSSKKTPSCKMAYSGPQVLYQIWDFSIRLASLESIFSGKLTVEADLSLVRFHSSPWFLYFYTFPTAFGTDWKIRHRVVVTVYISGWALCHTLQFSLYLCLRIHPSLLAPHHSPANWI